LLNVLVQLFVAYHNTHPTSELLQQHQGSVGVAPETSQLGAESCAAAAVQEQVHS
jgi:hypothetical protein